MLSKLRRLLQSGHLRPSAVGAKGRATPGARHEQAGLLFAFRGGDKTWGGMGQRFYREEEVFRRAIERCGPAAERQLGFSLPEFFSSPEMAAAGGLAESERRRIVILAAFELALCDLWRAYGVEPGAAIGVSGGEVAAAYAAGGLSLEDAAEVICSVAVLATQRPSKGHFVWLEADFEKALQLSRVSPTRLDVVAEISPLTSLAYCTAEDFPEVVRLLTERGVNHRAVRTEWAHHTPWAAGGLSAVEGKLYTPRPRPLRLPFYSSATGGVTPPGVTPDPHHWYSASVTPSLFARAMCAALSGGHQVVLNVSAHPSFKGGIEQCAETLNRRALILNTMSEGEPEAKTWTASLDALRAAGLVGRRPGAAGRGGGSADADDMNLLSPDVVRDPYPHYAALRRGAPVRFLRGHGFWLVLGYDDVSYAFKHPQVFSSARPEVRFDPVLVEADAPAHTRVRRMLSPYFTPQAVQALEAYSRDCAARLLSRGGGAEFDLVGDFAEPLTELTMGRVLGLTEEEVGELRRRLAPNRHNLDSLYPVLEGWMREYLGRRPEPPGASVGGHLLRSREEATLSPEEVLTLMKMLWSAGTHTMGRLVATSAFLLLRHPEVRAEVQNDLRLLPKFIEESMRLEPPEQMASRRTVAEVELSGVTIPAGAEVRLSIAAANRDPAHFADPDALSLSRHPNDHLSFAAGPHFCLGAMMARMEARVALETLLTTWPNFSAARPLDSVSHVESIRFRALKSLFVRAA